MTAQAAQAAQAAPPQPRSLDDVPGWFHPVDQGLFAVFLEAAAAQPGDVLEMGCYLGKSAIVMGRHVCAGEEFTVCDLFGDESCGRYSRRGTHTYYSKRLTRDAFGQLPCLSPASARHRAGPHHGPG
ncbi:hypothetical protein ACFQVC_08780 [Streptomyces monticola]|uniref:Class I SAM-dependent methyltransferase n=1 Tax=Streptomyces monticola TaxID=2666263 RepID=A0ABW2JE60_9ACTN